MTYEDVLKQIQGAGLLGQFSSYDLDMTKKDPAFGASMLSYKQDWNNAQDEAGRSAANQAAEQLRRQYGSYYGGSDGSKYYGLGPSPGSYQSAYQDQIRETLERMRTGGGNGYQSRISETLDKMNGYGDFSYGPAPTYRNRYQQELDALLGKVQNYGPFSWSKEEDPSYSAYAKQYRREGDRATANALAQAASAAGGQVSTAAMTAASQAGDYYAGQLADKIPELYENAYQRYLSEYSKLADQLGQTQRAEQYDYAKYLDQLGQYNTDRAQSYDQWLQGYNMLGNNLTAMQGQARAEDDRLGKLLSGLQSQDSTEYGRLLDQVNYQAQQDALAREQAANDRTLYQQQLDAILAAGGSPSAGMIAGSGYQNEYVQALENYYKQQMRDRHWAAPNDRSPTPGGVVGGSSGRSSGGTSGDGTASASMDYGGLFAAAMASGNPKSFIANRYRQYGFSSSSGLWDDYKSWAEGQESQETGGTGLQVDMRSISELGYGPIDEAALDGLVASGQVEEYVDGNMIRFRRTGAAQEVPKSGIAWNR